jgi:hypothetical protein
VASNLKPAKPAMAPGFIKSNTALYVVAQGWFVQAMALTGNSKKKMLPLIKPFHRE